MLSGVQRSIPLRLGTDYEFAQLRSALGAAGYTEQAICQRLGLQKLSQFKFVTELRPPLRTLTENPDSLDLLIRLFLENEPVERDAARMLPLDILAALGLVVHHASDDGLLSGTWRFTRCAICILFPIAPAPSKATSADRLTIWSTRR